MSYTKFPKEELYLEFTIWLLIVTKHGSLSTWNVRSLKPLVFLLMQWFEGLKTVVFFCTPGKHKARKQIYCKSIVSQLICFQSIAWTLQASPHPCAFFSSPIFPTASFPNPNHENCLRNWKAITSICWRSWLTWLNYSGHPKRVLRSFFSSRWRPRGGNPRFHSVARLWRNKYSCAFYMFLPWKFSIPNTSKVVGRLNGWSML